MMFMRAPPSAEKGGPGKHGPREQQAEHKNENDTRVKKRFPLKQTCDSGGECRCRSHETRRHGERSFPADSLSSSSSVVVLMFNRCMR